MQKCQFMQTVEFVYIAYFKILLPYHQNVPRRQSSWLSAEPDWKGVCELRNIPQLYSMHRDQGTEAGTGAREQPSFGRQK